MITANNYCTEDTAVKAKFVGVFVVRGKVLMTSVKIALFHSGSPQIV